MPFSQRDSPRSAARPTDQCHHLTMHLHGRRVVLPEREIVHDRPVRRSQSCEDQPLRIPQAGGEGMCSCSVLFRRGTLTAAQTEFALPETISSRRLILDLFGGLPNRRWAPPWFVIEYLGELGLLGRSPAVRVFAPSCAEAKVSIKL